MEILGFVLIPYNGVGYEVIKDGETVGFISFMRSGYVKVSKYVLSSNKLTHEEVPLAIYDATEIKIENIKFIKKCLRRLRFSLFIDKILLRN